MRRNTTPGLPTAPMGPVDSLGTADNFSNLGHIFKLSSVKPEYKMNTHPIPNAILQMAYSKLFIPLSVLTSMALDKIQFNDGLKFHKFVFGNGSGKHSLDVSTFPTELSLTEMEFWQAYCNWLSLIDIIAEPAVADGWKLHYAHMISDVSFSTWFSAWQEHNRLLQVKFMADPFIVNPNHSSYANQLEQCRGTQNDSLAAAFAMRKESSSTSK